MSAAEQRSLTPEPRSPTPEPRSLTPEEEAVAAGLAPFRRRLDEIDAQLVDLLGERFQICREVAVHKAENEIDMMQPGRVEIVRARYLSTAPRSTSPATSPAPSSTS